MNKEISKKLINKAVSKNVGKPLADNLLIYLVVINKHTGKAEITEFSKNKHNGCDNPK